VTETADGRQAGPINSNAVSNVAVFCFITNMILQIQDHTGQRNSRCPSLTCNAFPYFSLSINTSKTSKLVNRSHLLRYHEFLLAFKLHADGHTMYFAI